jgi:hypothetical protein
MRIQALVETATRTPNGWVQVELVQKVPVGLDLVFSVHRGRRGKSLGRWTVCCRGVHEVSITDLDGGGLAVYPASHPAARQYVAGFAELKWPRSGDTPEVLAALQQAHLKAVDDWIPFDRYLRINTPWNGTPILPHFAPISGNKFVCNGPDFLLKAYAKALSATGQQTQLRHRRKPSQRTLRPQVLHFGSSYVVADHLIAERHSINSE